MKQFAISLISDAIKGELQENCPESSSISFLVIDSRKVVQPEKSLFFAFVTKKNDGHKYIKELYKKGVRNFVVEKIPDEASNFPANFIVVKNTLEAIQILAAYHRSSFSIPVIGITGSNGKTTVKEWIDQLIGIDKKLVCNPKSYNSQIGVPLSVLEMTQEHEIAVFEAGISEPNEMNNLQAIIQPTIGIFTNIGQAHDENFLTRTQKIAEKLKLFSHVETLIYSIDHTDIHNIVSTNEVFSDVKKLTWGERQDADIQIKELEISGRDATYEVRYTALVFQVKIPFSDKASIENAFHAIALMLYLEYNPETIISRIATLTPIEMRLELKEGINNCTIINDSYSSDINSLIIALDFLEHQTQHAKKTLILSDILQSGRIDSELYEEIGQLLAKKGITYFIGIGESLSQNSDKFSMKKKFFLSTDEFLEKYPISKFNNETVLLKGARTFEFEKISRILQKRSHQTVLQIDLSALISNFNYFRSQLKPETKLMAMVKAFSYGSGSVEIANALQFNQADYLTVAYTDEGVDLRQAGITVPIMVMNPEEESFDNILRFDLEPDIYNFRSLDSLLQEIELYHSSLTKIPIHIELDTGMHRLGFMQSDLEKLVEILKQNPVLEVQSVFSHLVASEDSQSDFFTLKQIESFKSMVQYLKAHIDNPFLTHILNSSGISRFPQYQFDMVRLGIGLYGISSDEQTQKHLQNVGTLKTIISQIKTIESGDSVGYNRKWIAPKESVIGILPIGYADGLNRKLGNGIGKVWINGQFAPIVGSICMDMCMIDITNIDCKELDEVIIFGKEISVSDIAKSIDTIPYEILTSISHRVKRVYFQE